MWGSTIAFVRCQLTGLSALNSININVEIIMNFIKVRSDSAFHSKPGKIDWYVICTNSTLNVSCSDDGSLVGAEEASRIHAFSVGCADGVIVGVSVGYMVPGWLLAIAGAVVDEDENIWARQRAPKGPCPRSLTHQFFAWRRCPNYVLVRTKVKDAIVQQNPTIISSAFLLGITFFHCSCLFLFELSQHTVARHHWTFE